MIKITAHTSGLIFLLGALAASAQAQPVRPASDPSIVVTGRQPLSEDQALDVIQRVARPVDGQLARFHEPICPRVTGFETQYERIVAERIKEIAAAAGARTGGEGCVANFHVVIVDDGREFVDILSRQHPEALAGVDKRELRRLENEEGAARSWSVTVLTNSAGLGSVDPASSSGSDAVQRNGASVGFGGGANVMRVHDASTINPSAQQTMVTSWVVIETAATLGKPLTTIADYAAMRGLAMVRPSELADGDGTILALFEPGAGASAAELTEFDRAYLKGLYSVQGRRWARQQVRQMADMIARETEQANP